MLNRASRLAVARIALALMLFAQGAMAWSACELPERAPEQALRPAALPLGCDQMTAEPEAVSAVCFSHCLAGKQSLDKPALDLPALSPVAALIVDPASDASSVSGVPPYLLAPVAGTGPPRRILLQSFQI